MDHFRLDTRFFQFGENDVQGTGRVPLFPGTAVESDNFQDDSPLLMVVVKPVSQLNKEVAS
jgi:hypothetical protein